MRFLMLAVSIGLAAAQQQPPANPPAQAAPGAQAPGGRGARTPQPTGDPNTPGYVAKKELPDGQVPAPQEDADFTSGPPHPASPDTTVQGAVSQGTVHEFTMASTDSKIYPGIARD